MIKRIKGFFKKFNKMKNKINDLEKEIQQLKKLNAEYYRIANEALELNKKKTEPIIQNKNNFIFLTRFDENDLEYNRELMGIYRNEQFQWFLHLMIDHAFEQFKGSPDLMQKQRIAAWIEGFDLINQSLLKHEIIYHQLTQKDVPSEN